MANNKQLGVKSRIFRATLGALLLLSRAVWLLPVSYSRQLKRYRTRLALTFCACASALALTAAAPVLFRQHMSLYAATNVQHTSLFEQIAALTLASDSCLALLLLLTQIWRRRALAEFLNVQAGLMAQPIAFGWRYALLLWLRLLFGCYDLFLNVPFLARVAGQLGAVRLIAYLVNLYVQQLSSIYANLVFAVMLSYLASLRQLSERLEVEQLAADSERLWRLIAVEQSLDLWLRRFSACFDFGIFLVLIGNFVNILANLYAMLAYFVEAHGVPLTMSNYVLIVSVELCALVAIAESCKVEQRRICARLAELLYAPDITESKIVASQFLSSSSVKFSILGMFELDHDFLLFLLSYATNFIVVILQFTLENMK